MAWTLSGNIKGPQGDASSTAALTHAATGKTTPVDADELPLIDSAATFGLKKLTWANLKAAVKAALTAADVGLGNVTNNAQYYPGGTDVAVTDGGTGASDAAAARSNLGVAYGATSSTVCVGNDARLSDTRTPTDNTVTSAKIVDGAIADADINASAGIVATKLAAAAQTSLGKADSAVQPGGALGTPASGTLTNCTFPTLNQDTTGSAAKLTTARTVGGTSFDGTANITQPYDLSLMGFGAATARAASSYGDNPMGIKVQRACTLTSVTFRAATADASGNLVVELRKNGTQISGTPTTIAAANQVAGGTTTGSWALAAGDILTAYITAVGTTPGKGLVADLTGACG